MSDLERIRLRLLALGVFGAALTVGALPIATRLTPGHPWSVNPTPEGWMAAAWIAAGCGSGLVVAAVLASRTS